LLLKKVALADNEFAVLVVLLNYILVVKKTHLNILISNF